MKHNHDLSIRKAVRQLSEAASGEKPLTDAGIKKLIPMFVSGGDGADHKCGSCRFRIHGGGDMGYCAIMEGDISMASGTCAFWVDGSASSKSDARQSRMSKSTAGYTEVIHSSTKINCGTCSHYSTPRSHCELWDGGVSPGDCCMVWENPEVEK